MVRRAVLSLGVLVVLSAPSTADAFSAHGSARQVYVTGLAPHARTTLLGPDGHRAARRRATALGDPVLAVRHESSLLVRRPSSHENGRDR